MSSSPGNVKNNAPVAYSCSRSVPEVAGILPVPFSFDIDPHGGFGSHRRHKLEAG